MAERAAKQLELNKSELPNSITEVIATLSRAGFDAYIVGGGVRDTLLGLRPKDFDAVTDAKPHEIKDVFGKRCRIIGRRFQLAHVYSGRELIEVATFRGPPTNNANTNQDGMILRDNVWGDIKQDFSRRDFSINALYYQPLKGVVHDFCGALEDIDNKVIRLLGHAPVRIEEDPVRLLRALRFKAKLGFEFDEELSQQFHDDNWALLEQISPHRLYDETQKMFTGGYLVPLLPLLFESGAIDSLIIYPPSEPSALVQQVAINTDKRIGAGKSINPAFFYAALLWENYLHQLEKAKKRNMPFAEAQMHAASKVIDRQRIKTAIPKFAEQFIRDIWILQPKLAAPRSKQIEQLIEHPRFRAGFDFLLLREQCGDAEHPLSESTNGMGDWWQTYQTLSERDQQQAIDDFDENIRRGAYKQGQRGRGRNRQKQIDNNQPASNDNDHQDQDSMKQNSANQNSANQNSANQNASKQSSSTQSTKQAVNNASNVPSKRRRRAPDNAAQTESPAETKQFAHNQSDGNKKPYNQSVNNGQSLNQDGSELAQLQQLSLANNSNKQAQKRHTESKPSPLFVIEHERVVPPLQRQLDTNKATQNESKKAPSESEHNKESVAPSKSALNRGETSKENQRAATKQADIGQAVNEKTGAKPSSSTVYPTRTVARSAKLVSINNEPIPSKRRRRQPSADSAVTPEATGNSSAQLKESQQPIKPAQPRPSKTVTKAHDSVVNEAPVAATTTAPTKRPAKATNGKATAAHSTDNASAASQTIDSKVTDSKVTDSKGPIPSKRRRRQPSTDNA